MNKKGLLKFAFACALAVSIGGNAMVTTSTFFTNTFSDEQAVNQNLVRHERLASNRQDSVGVQFVMALDSSESMEPLEYEIAVRATAEALNSEQVRHAIKYKSGKSAIAVAIIDFDAFSELRIPWVDIRGEEINDKPYNPKNPEHSSEMPDKLDALAQEIRDLPRILNGGTSLYRAMNLGLEQFLKCPWDATERKVLSVFSDGKSDELMIEHYRDKLAAIGATVNGLAIINEHPDLGDFFEAYMITKGGTGKSTDGLYSQRGRVWVAAQNMPTDDQSDIEMTAYYQAVVRAIAQSITTEISARQDNSAPRYAGHAYRPLIPTI